MEDLYETNEAWEADFEKVKKGIEELQKFEGTLGKSAENKMSEYQIRRLPVCDTNDKVIGILTIGDLAHNYKRSMVEGNRNSSECFDFMERI